jgi:predicted ATPase
MSWPEFWSTILPPFAAALAMVVTALAWTAVAYLKSVRDKFEEAKDREALRSARSTGIQAELERDPTASDKQVVTAAARHILDKGAPDAVKAFDLSGNDLARFISSAVGEERAKKAAEKKPC